MKYLILLTLCHFALAEDCPSSGLKILEDDVSYDFQSILNKVCSPADNIQKDRFIKYLNTLTSDQLKRIEHECRFSGMYKVVREILIKKFVPNEKLYKDIFQQLKNTPYFCRSINFAQKNNHSIPSFYTASREVNVDFFHLHIHLNKKTEKIGMLVGHTYEFGGGRGGNGKLDQGGTHPLRFTNTGQTTIITKDTGETSYHKLVEGAVKGGAFRPDDSPAEFPSYQIQPILTTDFRRVKKSPLKRCTWPQVLVTDKSGPFHSTGKLIPLYETKEYFETHRHYNRNDLSYNHLFLDEMYSGEERRSAVWEEYIECDDQAFCLKLRP